MAVKKRLTNAQKKQNAEIKKRLQAEGILPPDKPKLNRKKYVEEAWKEWIEKDSDCYVWDVYLIQAISIMFGARDKKLRVSQETIGVAKTIKLAIRLKEFSDTLRAEKRDTYTAREQYEYIKDILEA